LDEEWFGAARAAGLHPGQSRIAESSRDFPTALSEITTGFTSAQQAAQDWGEGKLLCRFLMSEIF